MSEEVAPIMDDPRAHIILGQSVVGTTKDMVRFEDDAAATEAEPPRRSRRVESDVKTINVAHPELTTINYRRES